MKRRIFFLFALMCLLVFTSCSTKKSAADSSQPNESAPVYDAAHNSRNALDWNGVYTGIIPCADCTGIKTMVQLNNDGTYAMKTRYLGESDKVFTSSGAFEWNDAGSAITLKGGKDEAAMQFQVGENILFKLDRNGNRITGALADKYELTKETKSLVNKRWKLIEIMGKPVSEMDLNKEPFIMLTGEAQGFRIAGNDGCNGIMGSYDVGDGNTISFSKLASTMMACPKGDVQKEMSEVFGKVDNYTLNEDGTMLSLNKARMAPLARFEVDYMGESN